MKNGTTRVKICQSCGTPMSKIGDYGTLSGRKRSQEYCRFCLHEGKFIDPKITMEQMINRTAVLLAKKIKLTEEKSRRIMAGTIPLLKRWQGKEHF
jgi:hypothetical protein